MAELVATMVVGPLLSMVKEKASSYLLEQYEVMKGMEDQHKILKRKLPAILDIITDAEQAAAHREGVTAWLEEVKAVAYEANEVFDEFKYEALRRKAKKEGQYKELGFHVVKLFPTHNRFVFRNRMGRKLRKIVQAIEVLVAEMNAFHFKYQQQQQLPVSKQLRETNHVISDPEKIISKSRADENTAIVKALVDQANIADLTVFPIVGMGGLGKTTLAQVVYNEPKIKKHFDLLLWVCVSDSFDVESLAKSILESAPEKKHNDVQKKKKDNGTEAAAGENDGTEAAPGKNDGTDADAAFKKRPLDSLQSLVSGQRFLLVLDDFWKRQLHIWELLKACLKHGGMGSVVLTTTRDGGLAEIVSTVKPYCDLKGLKDEFIKEIIETRAFSRLHKEEKRPTELVDMIGEIVNRCAGSPLAATALGSVLCTKTSKEEWQEVSRRSNICIEDTGILPILKLSYNDLPANMKQCFAFCAIYPKDYVIDVDKLIQLWIAHGFINEKQVRPETVGKKIFKELASRSFFQDVKEVKATDGEIEDTGSCYSRTTCKIHDLMHDVALSVKENECALATEDPGKSECAVATEELSQSEWLLNTARHLFVSCEEPGTKMNRSLQNSSPAIQTLLCTSDMKIPLQHLSKYSSLQALQICSKRRSFPLKPRHLHHLRYLDLSRSDIKELPEDMSILYNLQTLNLSGCKSLCELPREMKYMTSLRHLYTHGCPKIETMPRDLRKLTSLQTLTYFAVGSGSNCSSVGELGNLDLCGQLELDYLENVAVEDAKAANLTKKKELTDLTLKWRHGWGGDGDDAGVLEKLESHDGLHAIRIHGYRGTTFPVWMAMLQNIEEIHLFNCNTLKCLFSHDGDTSSALPNLKKLTLKGLGSLERLWEIDNDRMQGDTTFPVWMAMLQNIEEIHLFDCNRLKWLFSHDGDKFLAFPNLKKLTLKDLHSLERWWERDNDGIQGDEIMFPLLEKLFISDCARLTAMPGQMTFPNLQNACIKECPRLKLAATSPNISILSIEGLEAELFRWVARHMSSLINLELKSLGNSTTETTSAAAAEHSLREVLDAKENWNDHYFPLEVLVLRGFKSAVTELCGCFVHLQDLTIYMSDGLFHWPEKLFQGLVSLRKLVIVGCDNLTGYAQDHAEASTSLETSQILPRLESLRIGHCNSLVEVFNVPASLRSLNIRWCRKLESAFGRRVHQGQSAGARAEHLENLSLVKCDGLTGVIHLAPSLKELNIGLCGGLTGVIHSPSLESLRLWDCDSLSSLPEGPQAYSSLQRLIIRRCPGMKTLPSSLKQRLGSLQVERLARKYYGDMLGRIGCHSIGKLCS